MSNQSGIARGYFSSKDVRNLHKFMNAELKKFNTKIDRFLFCPFHIDGKIRKYKKRRWCILYSKNYSKFYESRKYIKLFKKQIYKKN